MIWSVALRVCESDPRDGVESNLILTVRRALATRDGIVASPAGIPAWCLRKHGEPECYWLTSGKSTVTYGPFTRFETGVLPAILSRTGGPHVHVRARTYTRFSGEQGDVYAWLPGRDAADALRTLVAASVMES